MCSIQKNAVILHQYFITKFVENEKNHLFCACRFDNGLDA